jgi:predicted pyridoxine 5'-phosphate oxidase superfamily flavin-nucleotide-binding protein
VWGTAKVIENDAELLDRLRDRDYPGKVERAVLFTIEAWDINCPQHIHPRFTKRQVAPLIENLQKRVLELEAELAALRKSDGNSDTPKAQRGADS